MSQSELIEWYNGAIFSVVNILTVIPKMVSQHAYANPNVQQFINSTEHHFDVIVSGEFFMESFLMFAHKHNAPVVTICPFGIPDFVDRQQGFLTPYSFVPHWLLPYTDNMSFSERWYNTIVSLYDWGVRHFIHLPSERELARQNFAHLSPLPPLDDIIRNVSVILTNSHRAISPPRPSMPNVIPIGGAHIKPAKPLPDDLKAFMDEANHGVIYISFGTGLKSSLLPKQFIDALIDTFKNLKQRVLWKYEVESNIDIPSNVMVRKWMPQNDILAHPNMKLFISHGGLFGTTESLYHGVPLLLIPFFGDQFRNAHRVSTAGFGKFIGHADVTKESISKLINELLSDESYLIKARQTSAIFKDNTIHPMDEAMFWIEHVAKFKGAKHFKSHAANMPGFAYLLLDVIVVSLLAIFSVPLLLYFSIRKLFQKKNKEKFTEKKQN